jgi:hypothetical protein
MPALLTAGVSPSLERAGLDDRAKYLSAADYMSARASLNFKGQEAPILRNQPRSNFNSSPRSDRLQMIHFDARADSDHAGQQMRLRRSSRHRFHHADHCRRREYRRQFRIKSCQSPIGRHILFKFGMNPQRQSREGSLMFSAQRAGSGPSTGEEASPQELGSIKLRVSSAKVIPNCAQSLRFKLR